MTDAASVIAEIAAPPSPPPDVFLTDEQLADITASLRARPPAENRSLRDVIPEGRGRIPPEEYIARVKKAQQLGMKSVFHLLNVHHSDDIENPAKCIIAGGGPSLFDNIPTIRKLRRQGAKIIACNRSHDELRAKFIPVEYGILLDPKDWVADYISPRHNSKYLLASQVHEKTFEKFAGYDAYLWHAAAGLGELEMLQKEFGEHEWISFLGPSVVGLRAIYLALYLGFREIHLMGIDGSGKPPRYKCGCYAPTLEPVGVCLNHGEQELAGDSGKLYSYAKPKTDPTFAWFTLNAKKTGFKHHYWSNHHMARSVYEFEDQIKRIDELMMLSAKCIEEGKPPHLPPFSLKVHGNPEYSAIAMLAAAYNLHADPRMNDAAREPPASGMMGFMPSDTEPPESERPGFDKGQVWPKKERKQ